MANLKALAGSKLTFVMPDGLIITWTADRDTDTSHVIDTIARFEVAADVPVPAGQSLAPATDPDHHAERYSPDVLPEPAVQAPTEQEQER